MASGIAGAGELADQLGDAAVEHGALLAASLVGERAGEEGLSRPGLSFDDQVEGLADPLAGGELGQRCAGDAAPGTAIDVMDVGAHAQLGLAQMAEIAPVVAVLGFAFDEHGEAVVEAELLDVGDVALLGEGLGHAGQAELEHAFDVGLAQGHGVAPPLSLR